MISGRGIKPLLQWRDDTEVVPPSWACERPFCCFEIVECTKNTENPFMSSNPFPRLAGGVLLGIGIDLVEVDRIRGIHQRQGDRFLQRVYSEEECAYCLRCKNPYPGLAARFAAKEAVAKAFRTGIGESLGWTSVCVVKGELGEPLIQLDDLGAALLRQFGGDEVMVSLTHTQDHAQAIAAIVRHTDSTR